MQFATALITWSFWLSTAYSGAAQSNDSLLCDEYEARARAGEPTAQVAIANCYLLGIGRSEDLKQAEYWLKESIQASSSDGMTSMASAHLFGKFKDPDYSYALNLLKRAIEDENASARFVLGLAHNNGLGVPKDRYLAITQIRSAAAAGHSLGQFVMFGSYELGLFGMEKDSELAQYWKKQLEQGLRRQQTSTIRTYAQAILDDEQVRKFVFEPEEMEQLRQYLCTSTR